VTGAAGLRRPVHEQHQALLAVLRWLDRKAENLILKAEPGTDELVRDRGLPDALGASENQRLTLCPQHVAFFPQTAGGVGGALRKNEPPGVNDLGMSS